jgi:hypothetical protein
MQPLGPVSEKPALLFDFEAGAIYHPCLRCVPDEEEGKR